MTVSGIPLLDANMIPSHGEVIMPAERWNAFAMEVKPSVVYVAMALWQHLRDSEGNANASTSGTSATAPPKKKRRHKQHK